jgi:putative molybdopterin biosynthesis protein
VTPPLRNADPASALGAWLAALRGAGGLQPLPPESIDLGSAAGRVTAEPVVALRSSPSFDAAAMDGIAVSAITTRGAPLILPADAYRPVDTGDVLPAGTDAVVRSEDVDLTTDAVVGLEVAPYANVRQVGEDIAAGEVVLQRGRRLGPADLAVVASVGEAAITVRRRPVVAILPSGDELVPLGTEAGPGQIVETNSLMLGAMAGQADATPVRAPIVPDDPTLLAAALERAASEADLVLLLSGSAKGTDDHTVAVIDRVGEVVVQGVAVKPGHPVVLGLVGSTPVIGVPGYPVSAALAFELFAEPLLEAIGGSPRATRPTVYARVRVSIRSTPHSDEWIRVRIGRVADDLAALPLRRGAGVLSSLARADGLVRIPAGSTGVAEGDRVEVELLRPLGAIEATLLVAGSTDPLLDRLAARAELYADPDGSANGAAALAAGRSHLALVTSEDLPAGAITVGAWERQIGLIVAPGDPLGIGGADGLGRPGLRIANRQEGSSSRRFLDTLLAERSLDPSAITGYGREARSHAACVAAVAAGVADCAVATGAACSGQPVEFIQLSTQAIALTAAGNLATDDRVSELRAALRSSAFRDEAETLGYRALPA